MFIEILMRLFQFDWNLDSVQITLKWMLAIPLFAFNFWIYIRAFKSFLGKK